MRTVTLMHIFTIRVKDNHIVLHFGLGELFLFIFYCCFGVGVVLQY
jgi:hypothetical protein